MIETLSIILGIVFLGLRVPLANLFKDLNDKPGGIRLTIEMWVLQMTFIGFGLIGYGIYMIVLRHI